MTRLRKTIWSLALLAVVVPLLGWMLGRSHQPRYNLPAVPGREAASQAEEIISDSFIWVAFSGGGTRAAAMAWKVLEELKKIPFTYQGEDGPVESNLADEIDYISGISGGSFAATAWPLFRDNPDEFRKRFLERDFQRALAKGLFWPPGNMIRLFSPEYDRINLAAELYDREVFDGKTYGDLPARPQLRIHATNVSLGLRFTFSESEFRLIGSDLASYPLGYACAASSAFPILLSPITIKNYGETKSIDQLMKEDRLYKRFRRNMRDDLMADFRRFAREFYNDKSNRYIHLADGGIVDNQGLEAILEEFETTGVINRRLNASDRPMRRLIFINVNAGVKPSDPSGKGPKSPGMNAVIEHTMVASMDILSAKRWMRIKELNDEYYKPVIDGTQIEGMANLESPYSIEISFRNITDPELRTQANSLPTSFSLTHEQLGLIDRVVPDLIKEDPEMQRLMRCLAGDRGEARPCRPGEV